MVFDVECGFYLFIYSDWIGYFNVFVHKYKVESYNLMFEIFCRFNFEILDCSIFHLESEILEVEIGFAWWVQKKLIS